MTRACARCGGEVEDRFRFCPWCAAPQRVKATEFFRAADGRYLRVSRYYGTGEQQAHLSFSVWDEDGTAKAVAALEEPEADRLASFLADTAPPPDHVPERTRLRRHRRSAPPVS